MSFIFNILYLIEYSFKKIESFILITSTILIMINSVSNAIGRYFLSQSLFFSEEINQFLVIFVTFIGFSYAVRQGRNIRMTAIYDLLSNKYKKIAMIIISLLSGILMFYLSLISLDYVLEIKKLNKVSPALHFPVFYIYSIIPISFGLASLQYFLTSIINFVRTDIHLSVEITENKTSDKL